MTGAPTMRNATMIPTGNSQRRRLGLGVTAPDRAPFRTSPFVAMAGPPTAVSQTLHRTFVQVDGWLSRSITSTQRFGVFTQRSANASEPHEARVTARFAALVWAGTRTPPVEPGRGHWCVREGDSREAA